MRLLMRRWSISKPSAKAIPLSASWPDLIRPSTSFYQLATKDVDPRVKPGDDNPFSSLRAQRSNPDWCTTRNPGLINSAIPPHTVAPVKTGAQGQQGRIFVSPWIPVCTGMTENGGHRESIYSDPIDSSPLIPIDSIYSDPIDSEKPWIASSLRFSQ